MKPFIDLKMKRSNNNKIYYKLNYTECNSVSHSTYIYTYINLNKLIIDEGKWDEEKEKIVWNDTNHFEYVYCTNSMDIRSLNIMKFN